MEKFNDFNHIEYEQISIIELLLSPRKFFAKTINGDNKKYLFLITFILGVSVAISRFDTEIVKDNLGRESLFLTFAENWISFWIACIVLGTFSSFLIWYFGGWWYRMRIKFSGVSDPDIEKARHVYIYSSFVSEGPNVLLALLYTALYTNYFEANVNDDYLYLFVLCFVFISLITSYIGAREVFDVSKWKARIWLIILPAIFYLFVMGAFGFILQKVNVDNYIESTNIPENREIISADSLSRLTLPSDWVKLKELADETSFQIGDPYNEVYCVVFSENKKDLEIEINDYYDFATANILSGISDSSIVEYDENVLSKYSSRTGLVHGTMDYLKLSYVCHIVETEQNFHQLIFWTLEEQIKNQLPIFVEVINSFEEVGM